MDVMEAIDALAGMWPKVSCILPVGSGAKLLDMALGCFLFQDYPGEIELVVVDNSDMPILELLPEDHRIVYLRCERKAVGALRNWGTQNATGEICVTWDEDDWYAPNRVTEQVKRLLDTGKAVTGWHNVLYWDMASGKAFKFLFSPGVNHPPYAMGTSQCYRKDWWQKHKFSETGVEDWPFSQEAMHAKQLDSCDAGSLCVALIHDHNVVSKKSYLGKHKQWPEVERTSFPKDFFKAVSAIAEKEQ